MQKFFDESAADLLGGGTELVEGQDFSSFAALDVGARRLSGLLVLLCVAGDRVVHDRALVQQERCQSQPGPFGVDAVELGAVDPALEHAVGVRNPCLVVAPTVTRLDRRGPASPPA